MDSAEQQIVDSITTTSNILVTVSSDPTVDELSAALGLTLILDKLEKRATAIFSGSTPAAITFLEPEKTFENTADSLRDFIIALNKEKADHLRYKVDGDVVKIFITPYKTTLSQADLEFSQGDYNVEMVLALGVTDPDHLDKALEAHGKILHDAKVMTITAGPNKSTLGTTDWHDDKASSLSEMIVSLVNAMKSSENLLDQQTSTALLTGIVSATDRFSNDRTSSQVMTLAAQLMAGGANQQLIAAKLQEAGGLPAIPPTAAGEGASESADGTELVIERDESEVPAAPAPTEKVIEPLPAPEPVTPVSAEDTDQLELEKQLAGLTAPSTGTMADIEKELQDAAASAGGQTTPAGESTPELEASAEPAIEAPATDAAMPGFEATTTPVDNPAPSNDMVGERSGPVGIVSPDQLPAMNGTMAGDNEEAIVDPFNAPESLTAQTGTTITPDTSAGTPEGAAILSAPPEAPALPEVPELPSLPSLDTVMASSTDPVPETTAAPVISDVPELPPLPPLPPLPGDASLPPLPPPPPPPVFNPGAPQAGAVSGDIFGDTSVPAVPAAPSAPAAPAPGQFQIPGQ